MGACDDRSSFGIAHLPHVPHALIIQQRKIPQAIKMFAEKDGRVKEIFLPSGALATALAATHWHRLDRGRGYGDLGGWSWRDLLDVAYGCVRHRYEVFRGVRRDQVSREGSQWQHAGRRHVCLAAWVHEEWQGALVCARGCGRIRSLCGDSSDRHGIGSAGIGDDGHHDVERSSGRAMDHRHRDRCVGRGGHLRWREDHL